MNCCPGLTPLSTRSPSASVSTRTRKSLITSTATSASRRATRISRSVSLMFASEIFLRVTLPMMSANRRVRASNMASNIPPGGIPRTTVDPPPAPSPAPAPSPDSCGQRSNQGNRHGCMSVREVDVMNNPVAESSVGLEPGCYGPGVGAGGGAGAGRRKKASGPGRRQDPPVHLRVLPRDLAEVEAVLDEAPAGTPEGLAEPSIAGQADDSGRQCGGIRGGNQDPRPSVLDDVPVAGDVRGDRRDSVRHGLEERVRDHLGERWQDEDVRLGEMPGDIVHAAEEAHAVRDAEDTSPLVERGLERPIAEEAKTHPGRPGHGRGERPGLEKESGVLLGVQAPREDYLEIAVIP